MNSMRGLALFAAGWVATAGANPRVMLFPAVGTTAEVVVAGRVLKHALGDGPSTLSKNLRRLATANWEGAPVEVRFSGQSASTVSGHDGNFLVHFRAGKGQPLPVGLSTVEALVKGADPGSAMVDVMADEAPFFVISDFDDTVAVTNVLDPRALVESTLLKDEDTQAPVDGMADFYRCLRADKASPPVFNFVSGSPVQYAPRMAAFLSKHGFPVAGLTLRDLGPRTMTNYKPRPLRALLERFSKPVVLIGDSGEKDPEVYAQLRRDFPNRVLAVFIRRAGRDGEAARFPDMVLFRHAREAALEAVRRGLASESCVSTAFPIRDGGTP
jgi:phosphatidate phosphatase APP1